MSTRLCRCGSPSESGKKSCSNCLEKARNRQRERAIAGLCASCNNKAINGKTLCRECANKRTKKIREKRALGMCIKLSCKNMAIPGETRCEHHKRKRNKYNKKVRAIRIAEGVCARCGQEKKTDIRLCTSCKEKTLAFVHEKNFGGNRELAMIRDKKQCRLCSSEKNIIIHHRDGSGQNLPISKRNNNIKNLIALCRRCHADIHRLGNKKTRHMAIYILSHPGQVDNSREYVSLSGWKNVRSEILNRDRNKCILCPEKGGRLIMHHLDDRGLLSQNPNNNPDNLVTLCRSCHNAITNLRNNTDRQLACQLVRQLGPVGIGTPTKDRQ